MGKRVVAVGAIIQTPEKNVKVIFTETQEVLKYEVGMSGYAEAAWEIHVGSLSPNATAGDLFRS